MCEFKRSPRHLAAPTPLPPSAPRGPISPQNRAAYTYFFHRLAQIARLLSGPLPGGDVNVASILSQHMHTAGGAAHHRAVHQWRSDLGSTAQPAASSAHDPRSVHMILISGDVSDARRVTGECAIDHFQGYHSDDQC